MLNELLLLRHAHARPAAQGQDDAARSLSRDGLEGGLAAGQWLLNHCPPPDLVLCSTAVRTRQTLSQLEKAGCVMPAVLFEPRIYDASLGNLLGVIEAAILANPDCRRLWLIGHNPGLEQLSQHLDAASRPHVIAPAGIVRLLIDRGLAPTERGAATLAATWAP